MTATGNGNGVSVRTGNSGYAGSQPAFVWKNSLGINKFDMYYDSSSDILGLANTTRAELLRFLQNGNILINTTTDNGVDKLQVNGSISATNLASGTYTPTITNGLNVTSSTPGTAHYLRIGNEVHVSGTVNIGGNAGGANFTVSLPIASNMTANADLTGQAQPNNSFASNAVILADFPNDTANVLFSISITSSGTINYDFIYTLK